MLREWEGKRREGERGAGKGGGRGEKGGGRKGKEGRRGGARGGARGGGRREKRKRRGRRKEGGGGGTEGGKGREDTHSHLFSPEYPSPLSASPSIIASIEISGRTSNRRHASLSGSGFPKALAIQRIYRVSGGS